MSRTAPKPLLVLGDSWKIEYDGERCYEIFEFVEIDKSHRLAKKDGDTHRWVGRGYYGEFTSVVKALFNKAVSKAATAGEGQTVLELMGLLDAMHSELLEAIKNLPTEKKAA